MFDITLACCVCSHIRILHGTVQIHAQHRDLLISPVMEVLCRQANLFRLVQVAPHSTPLCRVNIAKELSRGLTSMGCHLWAAKRF